VKDPRIADTVLPKSAKALWVGVVNSDVSQSLDGGASGAGDDVSWLISGLDPSRSISASLPFYDSEPVEMMGDRSLDLAASTGGESIRAGRVFLKNAKGQRKSAYAYFVDDNGMKAQLVPSNSKVINSDAELMGGGLLPGAYDLSVLRGLTDLAVVTDLAEYQKLISLEELRLMGANAGVVRERAMDYTVSSLGVLSNVRKGGLKKDLTIAFEKDAVFQAAFPSSDKEKYLIMDSEKLTLASDLQKNGYINFEILKDYYNLKKYIKEEKGVEYLDTVSVARSGLRYGKNEDYSATKNKPFYVGGLGPHDIGDSKFIKLVDPWAPPSAPKPDLTHKGHPYGDYEVLHDAGKGILADKYKHNPITTVLSLLREDAWIEKVDASHKSSHGNHSHSWDGDDKDKYETNVQLWTSHYNPYNIALRIVGVDTEYSKNSDQLEGAGVINYPQVQFSGDLLSDLQGLDQGREINVSDSAGPTMVPPGKSRVLGFEHDQKRDNAMHGRGGYIDRIAQSRVKSVYRVTGDAGQAVLAQAELGGGVPMSFVMDRPALTHGTNENKHGTNDMEVAQVFFNPFSWDLINGTDKHGDTGPFPGKQMKINGLGEGHKVWMSFHLRTTRESDSSAIRPLIDANIRATWNNPKWDSGLGLNVLASYAVDYDDSPQNKYIEAEAEGDKNNTFWGAERDSYGEPSVVLFDVPRSDLVSLGQLQHANCGRFSYEPTYIIGNSYSNLRIKDLKSWKASVKDDFTASYGNPAWGISGNFNLYDASYLVNDVLWDGYTLTTLPQVNNNYKPSSPEPSVDAELFKKLKAREAFLPNPRYVPYEPKGVQFDLATIQNEGDATSGSFYTNAGMLMVDGAFNINSTSVDAWEAFLSGTHKLAVQKLNSDGQVSGFHTSSDIRFPRVSATLDDGVDKNKVGSSSEMTKQWIGYRNIKQEEIRELAERLVEEIKKRGPFLSLGEFVNRTVDEDKITSDAELGKSGALQAALDLSLNKDLDGDLELAARNMDVSSETTQGSGFPTQVLQGDVLQALAPYMQARSDSFTIRAYGESINPVTGKVRAKAWCEAVVQRYSDPVKDADSDPDQMKDLANPKSLYGRKFRMISFRWLSPDEI